MANRTINGYIRNLQDEPCKSETLKFRLIQIGADKLAPAIYKSSVQTVTTDATGFFEIDLWTNENSILATRYRLVFTNGDQVEFDVPAGATPIDIVELL